MTDSPRRAPAIDVGLIAVLATAVGARLWYLDTALIDAHSWRQITNADIARHFMTTLDLFHPQVSWGGRDGVVGMEFPLLQWLTGLLWRVTGESAVVARLVALSFSLAGVVCLYGLGERLLGRAGGLAAAALMAVAPSTVFFGRSFLSDTPMLTFMIAAVWAWDVYFERASRRRLILAATLTALAALVKLPAILVLAPIVGAAWRHRQLAALTDRGAWLGGVVAVALVAAWYWHADRIYLETGLTQAVFRPSGTYPPDIAPGVQFTSVSHWATRARLLDLETWRELADRFWQLHLTAFGAAGVLLGLWRAPRATRAPIDLWLLAGLVLFVVALEGQYWHEFHQLPLLPPLFLYFGAAAAPLFDGAWQTRTLPRRIGGLIVGVTGIVCAVQAARASGVELHLYRPANLQQSFVQVGEALRAATAPDALVLTVEYEEAGANSAMLLYFAHRQGWSFDVRSITAGVVPHLADRGARYFATTNWAELEARKPEVAALLVARYKALPLADVPSGARLFDLTAGR
ncbi:MAG: glycosyltransferase family 39 protein [Acidobacteria bacterium]|nr:glycosyltransferase family 39 protein [Acidobacteriota bacterium]